MPTLAIPPMGVFERRQLPHLGSLHGTTVCPKGVKLLSVVVPVFNEESALPLFVARLRPVMDELGKRYEVLAVDDGSRDATAAVLRQIRQEWPQLRVVTLRRNAGHQAALTAGFDLCLGDLVVTMDADLQDPPELIPAMIATAVTERVDIVFAVRADRSSDNWFKRQTAGLYYRIMRSAAGQDIPNDSGDYRLVSRRVVEALRALPERHRVYRLLIPWLGFQGATVSYTREKRAAGQSKYPLPKMIGLAADSVTSFTAQPLRIATWLGLIGGAACIIAMLAAVIAQVVGATVPGWASVFVAILFVGAAQLLCLGLLGEYVGRLYAESQHRPLYYVATDTAETSSNGSA